MLSASGVECGTTGRTRIIRGEILIDSELISARTAQDRFLIKLDPWPNSRRMIGDLGMAIETRIPPAAALELNGDYVERRMPVRTPGLAIDVDSQNLTAVNNSHE